MNRRDFLKVVTLTAAAVAVPSLIPADARFVLDAGKYDVVIGNIARDITFNLDRNAHFVYYKGTINNADYYCGDFVKEVDEKKLRICDMRAMQAFKNPSKSKFIKISF